MLRTWHRAKVLEYLGLRGRHTINRYIEKYGLPEPFNRHDAKRAQDLWFPETILQWDWDRMARERPDLLPYLKRRQDAIRRSLGLDELSA